MTETIEKALDREEASKYLEEKYGKPAKLSAKYLAKLATEGGGPEFERFGRRIGYRPSKLDEYVKARKTISVFNTSAFGNHHAK